MQRMGMIIGIEAAKIADYKALHANCWPEILKSLSEAHLRNYSIWLHEGECLLFAQWEYHGVDFEADMQAIAALPETQRWWALCGPCQRPVASREPGEHWSMMEEVFFHP